MKAEVAKLAALLDRSVPAAEASAKDAVIADLRAAAAEDATKLIKLTENYDSWKVSRDY